MASEDEEGQGEHHDPSGAPDAMTEEEFVATVREKRWQRLQDGDYHDEECSPELRAVAAMVESFLGEGVPVRVWCWHSQ